MKLVIEAFMGVGSWQRLGIMAPGHPLGSMSDNKEDKRDIIVFGFDGQTPKVWRSPGGVDHEVGNGGEGRVIYPTDSMEVLAEVGIGRPWEHVFNTDRGHEMKIRLRFINDRGE